MADLATFLKARQTALCAGLTQRHDGAQVEADKWQRCVEWSWQGLHALTSPPDQQSARSLGRKYGVRLASLQLPYAVVLEGLDRLAGLVRSELVAKYAGSDALLAALEQLDTAIGWLRRSYLDAHLVGERQQLVSLAEASSDYLILASLKGKPFYANAAARRLIGVGRDEGVPGHRFAACHAEETWRKLREVALPAVKQNGRWAGPGRLCHQRTGQVIDVEITTWLVRHPHSAQPICLALLYRDIAQRAQVEESEQRKTVVMESALDPIITVNHEGVISEFNRAAEVVFLRDRSEAIGRRPEDLLFTEGKAGDRIDRYVSNLEGSMLGKRTEVSAVRANGEVFPAELAMTISRMNNQPVFTLFIRDVSERNRAEQALRDSEALYQSLVESLPMNVFRKDLRGRFTFGNRRFCESLGIAPDELVGKTDFDFYPRELAEKYRSDDRSVIRGGRMLEAVEEQQRPDGEKSYVQVVKTTVVDASGEIVGTQGIFWDVTARRIAEDRLRESEQRLQAVLDNTTAVIYVKDTESRYQLLNHSFEQLLGARREDLVGKTDYELFPKHVAEALRTNDRKVLEGGRPMMFEEMIEQADGPHTYLSIKVPLRDSSGTIRASCGISTDITSRKKAEAELRQAKEAAEAANRAKSAFLANVSHEIRTPLTGVIGLTELVLETELDAGQRECLTLVRDSGESLLAVINDLLDFSKIEAGRLDLDPVDFNLAECVGDTLKGLALRAHAKGIELAWRVAPEAPEVLVGDAGRLRQVLTNLVGNAVKFTEQGEVAVDVALEPAASGEVTGEGDRPIVLHFCVRDTGIGIPKDKQAAVFEAFEQADASTTRKYGGTGLGLAISARLIQLMEGRIWVESELGQGSHFHFTARFFPGAAQPCVPVPAERRGSVPLATETPLRILVAEDSLVNQKLASGVLEKWGHEVVVVDNGVKALAAVESADFDLVLMDVQMPEMDGLQAASAIRALEQRRREGKRLPVVAMTAHALRDDRQRCLEAGMDAYIAKPLRPAQLAEVVAALLQSQPGQQQPARPEEGQTESNGAESLAPEKQPGSAACVLDMAQALQTVAGDRALLRDLAGAFLQECPGLLSELRRAVASGDAACVQRAAHTLKGAMRYFGASRAFELAYRLETSGRDRNLDGLDEPLLALENQLEQIQPVLSAIAQQGGEVAAAGDQA